MFLHNFLVLSECSLATTTRSTGTGSGHRNVGGSERTDSLVDAQEAVGALSVKLLLLVVVLVVVLVVAGGVVVVLVEMEIPSMLTRQQYGPLSVRRTFRMDRSICPSSTSPVNLYRSVTWATRGNEAKFSG
ncbi:hypothetical protein CRUP_005154 [Coryphaenoides rupestris]|nr:hypothetical protein CRUP_005154 [Coryphaenoides rupestris]